MGKMASNVFGHLLPPVSGWVFPGHNSFPGTLFYLFVEFDTFRIGEFRVVIGPREGEELVQKALPTIYSDLKARFSTRR